MPGSWIRFLRVSVVALVLGWASRARAEVGSGPHRQTREVIVAIRYDSDAHLELAERLESELLSAGYTVDVRSTPEPSPCDQEPTEFVPIAEGKSVWIHLKADPSGGDAVIASICYLGTLPFVQRAAVRAPITEPRQLALATAEAVNGLRSKLPPWSADAVPPDRAEPKDVPKAPLEEPRAESPVNTLVLGTAVVWNLPDFPAAPGIVGRATLGITPTIGIAIEAFVPTTGRELTSPEVTATIRTSFVRAGPRFGGPLGDFELSGAALAGPAVTWANGEAEPPRIGTTDVTTGAVLTLAAFVEYPRQSSVFACASASASALLPGVEVDLGDGTDPRGAFPLEASIGFGARWGGRR